MPVLAQGASPDASCAALSYMAAICNGPPARPLEKEK
jgi:hypothetical protein